MSLPASTFIHCHVSQETLPWSQPHIRHTHTGPGEVYKKIPCKSAGDLRDSSIRHTAPLCHCLIPTAASGCKAAAKEGLGIKLIILVICRVKGKKKPALPTTWEKETTGRSDSREDGNCYGLVPGCCFFLNMWMFYPHKNSFLKTQKCSCGLWQFLFIISMFLFTFHKLFWLKTPRNKTSSARSLKNGATSKQFSDIFFAF